MRAGEVTGKSTIPAVVVLLGIIIGSAVAFFFHTLLTTSPRSVSAPLLVHEFTAAIRPPHTVRSVATVLIESEVTVEHEQEARRSLDRARKSLENLDGRHAATALRECVQTADLPQCHLELGLLLLVVDDAAGYAHLERYLELEPSAGSRASLRAFLDSVQTSTKAR